MNLDELARKANERMKQDNIDISDSRISSEITTRRIQSYQTQGIIPKPYYNGRKAVYDEEHLEALLSARKKQYQGNTDRQLRSQASTTLFQTKAPVDNTKMIGESDNLAVNDIIRGIKGKLDKSLPQNQKTYREYQIMDNPEISLKISLGAKKLSQQEIIELKEITMKIIDNINESGE